MIQCSVSGLKKYYGAEMVFENISFELHSSERVGLIGQNGCGKTTLMKILMGEENYQEGSLTFGKGVTLGYLHQIFTFQEDTTVKEVLEQAFEEVWKLKEELRNVELKMKELSGRELEKSITRYSSLVEKYELNDGYDVEVNIDKVCQGLRIPEDFMDKPFQQLSGGERTRVLLARLLLQKPDVLLLDEPTNHLDMDSVEWLEDFLIEYNGTVLMVSHDRVFLDRVVNRIIELESSRASIYNGNYSYYVEEKERRFQIEYREYLNNQRKIDMMEKQIERYRIWGAMRDSEKMYKRAKELEKRLDKLEVVDKPLEDAKKIRLGSSSARRTGKIVLDVEQLSKSFSEKKLFKDLSFTLFYQDRLCIMGVNGSGKSTLLNIILGELSQDSGKIRYGSNVNIGFLPQNITFHNEDVTILEYFTRTHGITEQEARNELARLLFVRDDVFRKIKVLSGGEKSRLKLCSLLYTKVNLLILDEPTNHLDIDTREVLENTLLDYEGTILFVSHDRYFVEKVAKSIIVLEEEGYKIYPFGYDDYMEKRAKRKQEEKQKDTSGNRISDKKKKPSRKPDHAQKIERLEMEIKEKESRLLEVSKQMEHNNDNPDELMELYRIKEELEEQIILVMEEWESLQEAQGR
ncbi:ribosomal protection-like ABC-F family protein [Gudongella sp. DL1XJH-153]|uniref:ribosomal protection-like ABC-F family protein n=1 Tax=Gudongella sp. DL1XJH-153 TaxID=3409804 RepID=UPI003BB7956E